MKQSTAQKPVQQGVRVAVFTQFFPPAHKGGGPIRTLEALVATTPPAYYPLVFTTNTDLGEAETLKVTSDTWLSFLNGEVYYSSINPPGKWIRGLFNLRKHKPQILYFNSFFDLKFSILPLFLAKQRFFGKVEILLAPRGEFSKGALDLKPKKKYWFIALSRLLGLHRDIIWHASSEKEKNEIRNVFPRAKHILIKEDETLLSQGSFLPQDANQRNLRAVFLSRLSPIKGLDILLESLIRVTESIDLDIIGAEEDNKYVALCKKISKDTPNNIHIRFIGDLAHSEVLDTINQYDVMLFPTRGENFGHVIAEALSQSVFVFCSDNTPWSRVLESGGGRVVSPNTAERWTEELSNLAKSSRDVISKQKQAAFAAYQEWERSKVSLSVFEMLEKMIKESESKE